MDDEEWLVLFDNLMGGPMPWGLMGTKYIKQQQRSRDSKSTQSSLETHEAALCDMSLSSIRDVESIDSLNLYDTPCKPHTVFELI